MREDVDVRETRTTEHRYDLLESASIAFLVAIEALSPSQRAVLLLRDVFDYTGHEAALALDMSHSNIKTTLHRARKAMAAYDLDRCVPTRGLQQRTRESLAEMMIALVEGDSARMEAVLADDAVLRADGGGEFLAGLRPIRGQEKIARFFMKTFAHRGPFRQASVAMLNGLPALIAEMPRRQLREAERFVLSCNVDGEGKITRLHSVLAAAKLTAIDFA